MAWLPFQKLSMGCSSIGLFYATNILLQFRPCLFLLNVDIILKIPIVERLLEMLRCFLSSTEVVMTWPGTNRVWISFPIEAGAWVPFLSGEEPQIG